jgi:hypothetical protein
MKNPRLQCEIYNPYRSGASKQTSLDRLRSSNLGLPALPDVYKAGVQQLIVESVRVIKVELPLQNMRISY